MAASGCAIRPRDGKAEERGERDRQHRSQREACVNRVQRLQLLGAGPQNQHDRSDVSGSRSPDRASGRGSASYSSPPIGRREIPIDRRLVGQHRIVLARQRRGENLAVHPERDVAAGDLLQLRRECIVEQEPRAERAQDLRDAAARR